MAKERLDILLEQKGYYPSREQAQRAIMAGLVFVDNEPSTKAGTKYPVDISIEIKGERHPYVSRGGLKLKKAIDDFAIHMKDKVVLDIGSSTGGFTDCSLKSGASYVYAIDVGYGQLDWKLRTDERVNVMERTNFRYVKPHDLKGPTPNFATIDVSFISLSNILPTLNGLLPTNSEVVALIKPQFEARKEQVEKKGIVRDITVHREVLQKVAGLFSKEGFVFNGLSVSPIKGGKGNIEFLAYLIKGTDERSFSLDEQIERVLKEAHQDQRSDE
jgi:23S rRNA (cytidine1920-2'-O)/16S rRNA (cytidine1409-2'-O)-methyltransferase